MKGKIKLSAKELADMQFAELDFEGEWKAFIGKPERRGTWMIWGESASGKTTLSVMLAKYLAELGLTVGYVSFEEGASKSIQMAFDRVAMQSESRRVSLYFNIDFAEMLETMKRQRSPKVIIIDSLQYTGLSYEQYKRMKRQFAKKLFIFVSHAKNKEPRGSVAMKIKYDAGVKIMVDGFVAYPNSRYGGGEPFIINKEKAIQNKKTKGNGNDEENSEE